MHHGLGFEIIFELVIAHVVVSDVSDVIGIVVIVVVEMINSDVIRIVGDDVGIVGDGFNVSLLVLTSGINLSMTC